MTQYIACGDPPVFDKNQHHAITMWTTPDLNLRENTDFEEMQKRLDAVEKRLAILLPDEELQNKYPALQLAYDHYKLIEAMVNNTVRNNE